MVRKLILVALLLLQVFITEILWRLSGRPQAESPLPNRRFVRFWKRSADRLFGLLLATEEDECLKLPLWVGAYPEPVDARIFPAVVELNRRGIVTRYSCEGHVYEHSASYACISLQVGFTFPQDFLDALQTAGIPYDLEAESKSTRKYGNGPGIWVDAIAYFDGMETWLDKSRQANEAFCDALIAWANESSAADGHGPEFRDIHLKAVH